MLYYKESLSCIEKTFFILHLQILFIIEQLNFYLIHFPIFSTTKSKFSKILSFMYFQ